MDFTVMTNFRVTTCADFDPEAVLDGQLIVEDDDDGAILISTSDPDAEAKLSAHTSVLAVEQVGKAVMMGDWIVAAYDPD
jgi:hypothetical protein